MRAVRTYGLNRTLKQLYQFKRLKFGTFMGADEFGNKFFENTKDYPYGMHRWVEYADGHNAPLADSTQIHPLWHRWLHCTGDTPPPSFQEVGQGQSGLKIAEGVHTPVEHHVNLDHRTPPRAHPTLNRERGYDVGHLYAEKGENGFYMQPGYPLNENRADHQDASDETWTPPSSKK